MNPKDASNDLKPKRKYISVLGIFEILILLLGIFLSFSSTIKPLKYTLKYMWGFSFTILGLIFVVIMIILIRKKFVSLIGIGLILVYLFVAGFGAVVCEMNAVRMQKISVFEGKEVVLTIDDSFYTWDGKSVSYDPSNMEYVGISGSTEKTILCTVDGESKKFGIYLDSQQREVYYIEISPSGAGIFLKLTKK